MYHTSAKRVCEQPVSLCRQNAERVLETLQAYEPTSVLFPAEKCLEDYCLATEDDDNEVSQRYFFDMSVRGEPLCYISVLENGDVSFCLAPEGCDNYLTAEDTENLLIETTNKYIRGRLPLLVSTINPIRWDDPVLDVIKRLPNSTKYEPLRKFLSPFVGATLGDFMDYETYSLITDTHAKIAHSWLMKEAESILGYYHNRNTEV